MNSIREYLTTILCAAIIGAIVMHLTGKNQFCSGILRLVTSVFLSICVVAPLLKIEMEDMSGYLNSVDTDAKSIVSDVSNTIKEETTTIIITQTQAYIEDKAALYGAQISAKVSLSDQSPYVPEAVELKGDISPYNKKVLTQLIKDDLGIPEEKQTWI